MMELSELLASMTHDGPQSRVTVGEDWLQGRSVFGGLQGALAAHAMRRLVPSAPLRALQVSFIAPVPAGQVIVRVQVLRTGKNVTHVEARLFVGEQLTTLVVGVYGMGRPSRVRSAPVQPQVAESKAFDFHPLPGLPAFLQHFQLRWLAGPVLFSGGTEPRTVMGAGLKDSGPLTEAHIIAFADVPPPVAFGLMTEVALGSSLTWSLEFFRDRFDDLALEGWRLDSEMFAANDGYTSQSVMLWGPGGVPVTLGWQTMVIFG